MLAYHNDETIKVAIIAELRDHAANDRLVKRYFWKNGKGCAVGCTIKSGNHVEYETRFGIPQVLARLEDRIFEGLPNDVAMAWPVRFMSAIKPGYDLSLVGWKFQHWLLTDEKVNPGINHPLVKDAVAGVASLIAKLANGEKVDAESAAMAERSAARSAAWSAASAASAESAESAARSAAWSAASAASAASAERSAARSAESAESAASAERSAAWSAESAASAERAASAAMAESAGSAASAESAARSAASAAYVMMADKLIELLEVA